METDRSKEHIDQPGQSPAIDKQKMLLLGLKLPQRIIAALGQSWRRSPVLWWGRQGYLDGAAQMAIPGY